MTSFDDWLRALRAAQKGPVTLPAATRGLAWSCPVRLSGDWSGAALEGSISIAPDAADPLATFTVTGPVVAGGYSTWTLSIPAGTGAGQTGGLGTDADLDGKIELPAMLRLTPSGGVKSTLFGAVFTVLGKA
jgi:hypothetical protein